MIARLQNRGCATLFTLAWLSAIVMSAASATPVRSNEWRFAVSLDDKPIGHHRFTLQERDGRHELVSEARFSVKVLFFNAYRYTHDATEQWSGQCLQRIDARTDDNGKRNVVRGVKESAGFVVDTSSRSFAIASCVKTFAYWNSEILAASHLLNPQTGDYVPVKIIHLGGEVLTVSGRAMNAEHYRITAASGDRLQIDLWYSLDKEWLALESITEEGRRLRYRRQ